MTAVKERLELTKSGTNSSNQRSFTLNSASNDIHSTYGSRIAKPLRGGGGNTAVMSDGHTHALHHNIHNSGGSGNGNGGVMVPTLAGLQAQQAFLKEQQSRSNVVSNNNNNSSTGGGGWFGR